MPELPDVEGFRRVAAEAADGTRAGPVRVRDPQVIRGLRPATFARWVRGRYVKAPRRHGKWLLLPTAGTTHDEGGFPVVLLHFGMTGMLVWSPADEPRHAHDRVTFEFAHGQLRYRDMRKLKGIHLARKQSELDAVLGDLGPDAYRVSVTELRDRLAGTRRQLKSAMMDQSRIAGLGNLCVDEILWRARIHPARRSTDVDDVGWQTLHQRMRVMLRQAARAGRVPDHRSWLTGHRDEPDGVCPRCSTALARGQVAGRTTVWCPACQPD